MYRRNRESIKRTCNEFDVMLIRWSEGQLETLMDDSTTLRKFNSINLEKIIILEANNIGV